MGNNAIGTILLVDDEAYVRESLAAVLSRRGFQVRAASGAAAALSSEMLEGADAVVTDLRMPGGDGLELLGRLVEIDRRLPVIVLTAHGTVPSAVECMRAGAFEYLLKPAKPDELVLVLERALAASRQRRELEYLRTDDHGTDRRDPIGTSAAWMEVVRLVEVAAPTDTSVLLVGETGTGKEEVAGLLHRRSRRRDAAFVRVNCAAIPPDLFESEFFGHRRGAFTGAMADRVGRFRVAHQGTLLLDEINSLSATAQAKVLRVLQDGTFERVGDSQPTTVDVRLVCATNVDLKREVEEGRFRADLFYRINVMSIHVPPLRDRPEDIPLLAEAFRGEFNSRFGKQVTGIAPEVAAALTAYGWPGNVRELRNVVERGVLLESGQLLSRASLPPDLRGNSDDGEPPTLREALAAEERRQLQRALAAAGGVRSEAARLLGIDPRNLSYYLRKHELMEQD